MRNKHLYPQTQVNRFPRQKGVAAIMLLLFVTGLFGFFILSLDGVRALQNRARFDEAIDIASLVVAADTNTDSAHQEQMVINYLGSYLPGIPITNIGVTSSLQNCDPELDATCGDNTQYIKYEVTADATFTRIIKDTNGPTSAFGDEEGNYLMGGAGTTRKYQSDTVDVIFVSDFSGSMNDVWNEEVKYQGVLRIIQDVSDKLDANNDIFRENPDAMLNRVAIVPFSSTTYKDAYTQEIYIEDLGEKYFYNASSELYDPDLYDFIRVNNKPQTYGYVPVDGYNVFDMYRIEFDFLDPAFSLQEQALGSAVNYHNVSLTSDITQFKSDIAGFYPGGYTASYYGLIRGAMMMANEGVNPRRLIVILSDGMDTVPVDYWGFNEILLGRETLTGDYEHFTTSDIYYVESGEGYTPYYFSQEGDYFVVDKQGINVVNTPYPDYPYYQHESLWYQLDVDLDPLTDPEPQEEVTDMGLYLVKAGRCDYIRDTINQQMVDDEEVTTTIAFIAFNYALTSDHWIYQCVGEENVYTADSYDEIENIITGLLAEEVGHLYQE